MIKKDKNKSPWSWIPSLYFAEGLPFITATEVAVILFANLGLSNSYNSAITSLFFLPSILIKFLFGPLLDLSKKTKRYWIILFQWIMTICFALIAFSIPTTFVIQAAVALFMVLAFNSALHDIAADGFYLLALDTEKQAFFVGIRNTFYRLANIFAQGILVAFVGLLFEGKLLPQLEGKIDISWAIGFAILALIYALCSLYHTAALPKSSSNAISHCGLDPQYPDKKEIPHQVRNDGLFTGFEETFKTFFVKKDIWLILFFLLTYRLGEAQLARLAKPFLMDSLANGGMAIQTSSIGIIYGTLGVIALLLGGILGGIFIAKNGLKKWILPMALFINIPDILYVLLAHWQPENIWYSASFVIFEQFGYGFGFTAYMIFLIRIADGAFKTAHYAFGTGIMAVSMFIPGFFAGMIQEKIGYELFFIWVCICTIPGIIASILVKKKIL
jgi:PAT family beta-lactamase induction signal transducer AmpG